MSPTKRTIAWIAVFLVLATGIGALVRKPIKRAFFDKKKTISTGRFQDPEGMAVDVEGNLYIADEDHCRLYMLDKAGKIVALGRPSRQRIEIHWFRAATAASPTPSDDSLSRWTPRTSARYPPVIM